MMNQSPRKRALCVLPCLSSWYQKRARAGIAPDPWMMHVRLMVLPVRTYSSDAPTIVATAAASNDKKFRLITLELLAPSDCFSASLHF